MGLARLALLLVVIAPAACYQWTPYDGDPAPVGTEIRVRTTNAGAEEIRRRFGETDGTVSGPVARWDDAQVSVTLSTLVRRAGFPPTMVTDTLDVAQIHVAGIDVKVLDRKNTAFLVAGIVGGAATLIFATRAFGGDNNLEEGGGPPVEEAVIVRIPLGIGR